MSFQMPSDGGSFDGGSSRQNKISWEPWRIIAVAVGVILVALGVIFWMTGPPMGSSNSGDNYGAGFADTFPDYGRLLLLFAGGICISLGLFKKRKYGTYSY